MVERYRPPTIDKNVIAFPKNKNGDRRGMLSPFQKGHQKIAGRKKGTPNKVPTVLKTAMMLATDNVGYPVFVKDKETGKIVSIENGEGGIVSFLEYAAKYHTGSYLALLGKLIPLQLSGEGGGPIKTIVASMTLQEMAQAYQDSLKADYE